MDVYPGQYMVIWKGESVFIWYTIVPLPSDKLQSFLYVKIILWDG